MYNGITLNLEQDVSFAKQSSYLARNETVQPVETSELPRLTFRNYLSQFPIYIAVTCCTSQLSLLYFTHV